MTNQSIIFLTEKLHAIYSMFNTRLFYFLPLKVIENSFIDLWEWFNTSSFYKYIMQDSIK